MLPEDSTALFLLAFSSTCRMPKVYSVAIISLGGFATTESCQPLPEGWEEALTGPR